MRKFLFTILTVVMMAIMSGCSSSASDAEIKTLTPWGQAHELTADQLKDNIVALKKAGVDFGRIEVQGKDLLMNSKEDEVKNTFNIVVYHYRSNGKVFNITAYGTRSESKEAFELYDEKNDTVEPEKLFIKNTSVDKALKNMAELYIKERKQRGEKIISAECSVTARDDYSISPVYDHKDKKLLYFMEPTISFEQEIVGGSKKHRTSRKCIFDADGAIVKTAG